MTTSLDHKLHIKLGNRIPLSMKNSSHYKPYLLTMVPLLFLVVFFLVPVGLITLLSFYKFVPGFRLYEPILTLQNYLEFFRSQLYLQSMLVTVILAAGGAALTLMIGYPVAYLIVRSGSKLLKTLLLSVTISVFMMSVVVRTYALLLIMGENGIVNQTLRFIGLHGVELVGSSVGVLVGLVNMITPFTIMTLIAPMNNLDRSLEEAARSLGATRLQAFVRVTLPLSVTALVAAFSIAFSLGVTAFLIPAILGGGRVQMISNLVYYKFLLSLNWPEGSMLATVLLIVTLAIFALTGRYTQQFVART